MTLYLRCRATSTLRSASGLRPRNVVCCFSWPENSLHSDLCCKYALTRWNLLPAWRKLFLCLGKFFSLPRKKNSSAWRILRPGKSAVSPAPGGGKKFGHHNTAAQKKQECSGVGPFTFLFLRFKQQSVTWSLQSCGGSQYRLRGSVRVR